MTHMSSASTRTAPDKGPVPCLVPDGRIEGRRLRGLSWNKTHQLWRVRIYYNGKLRFVGRFEDAITAAKAYDKAAVYLYGSSAITNFGIEACLADPSEVGSCIIRAKEEAEQQAAARQAGDGGSSSCSNSSTPSRQQQQHYEMSNLSQSPQQTSPNAMFMASMQNAHMNVPSPSSDSSCYSMSQLDALLLLSGGCSEPAAAAAASRPLTLAAAAAMAGVSPFAGLDDSSGNRVDANLLHQISGMSVESLTGMTATPLTATAAAATGANAAMPGATATTAGGSGIGSFPLQQPMQYLVGQTQSHLGARSTSLPGLGLTSLAGNSNSLAGSFPDPMDTSARLAQLFITSNQQQQQQHQSVAIIPPQLQFAGVTFPGEDLQKSLAMTAACTGQLLGAGRQQISITADSRAATAVAAAAPAVTAAVGVPPGLSAYSHQVLLQQHQQQALLRQQLLQQQLQALAVHEAMLSSTAAAAAAAAAAFPRSAGSAMNPSFGGACSSLFGDNSNTCVMPTCAGNGSPPALYTSDDMTCRWSMPL